MNIIQLFQVGNYVRNWGREKGVAAISTGVEKTVLYVTQLLTSGYAIVLGTPGYILGSIVNSTVGELDPVRTPRTIYPGIIIVGAIPSLWRFGQDIGTPGLISVWVPKTGFEIKASNIGVTTFVMPPGIGTPSRIRVGMFA